MEKYPANHVLQQAVKGALIVLLYHMIAWIIVIPIIARVVWLSGNHYLQLAIVIGISQWFSGIQLLYIVPLLIWALKRKRVAMTVGISFCAVVSAGIHTSWSVSGWVPQTEWGYMIFRLFAPW